MGKKRGFTEATRNTATTRRVWSGGSVRRRRVTGTDSRSTGRKSASLTPGRARLACRSPGTTWYNLQEFYSGDLMNGGRDFVHEPEYV